MKKFTSILQALGACLFFGLPAPAQLLAGKVPGFTHADTLRGSLNENRTWWNVTRYDIAVTPDYNTKTITGQTNISFKMVGQPKPGANMQVDLQQPLLLDSVIYKGQPLPFARQDINSWLINYPAATGKATGKYKGATEENISFYYHGQPKEAVRPPWDGGWIWKKDSQGRPWMSVACQGTGASVWYPCKDHQSDEPDRGASLTITVPDSLVAVANGRLLSRTTGSAGTTYKWEVKNPINNYNIIPYIGKYVHFGEVYNGEKGALDCDYWVLDYNLVKAKEHFKQAPLMLKAFEYWFGPYPFYEDGYKLVESPHLGMEHQSAVAYGNGYQNGYLGRDRSGTGEGLKWDYIIVHESGHEWFANNITTNDIADMWVHEGFTCYSETLFVDYWSGKEAADRYLQGLRPGIRNKTTIIGQYGVNSEGSGDMYNKGANLLHTIRSQINLDSQFRKIMRGLNSTFYHQTVTSKQVEQYISKTSGIDLSSIFDQYLRTTQVPLLEYAYDSTAKALKVKWSNCVPDFKMAEHFKDAAGQWHTIFPQTNDWKTIKNIELPADEKNIWDKNIYVEVKKVSTP